MGHSSEGHQGSDNGFPNGDYSNATNGFTSRSEYEDTKPTCFPASTLVETPYGKVRIGDLSKGQTVFSYDNGKLVPRVITRKRVRGLGLVLEVEFESGGMLRATGHHSFLTGKGWQKLGDLRIGDIIVQADAKEKVIARISSGKVEPVFNIYTAGEHNFIADGCVAHNFTHFRALRTVLHRLFLDGVVTAFLGTTVHA